MATYIKTLKEDNGDITYPQTKASAVLLTNNSDLETELAKYVTAEDIASTSALTPPVQTNMIADGAVTKAKIGWSSLDSFSDSWTGTFAVPQTAGRIWELDITGAVTGGKYIAIATANATGSNTATGMFIRLSHGSQTSAYTGAVTAWAKNTTNVLVFTKVSGDNEVVLSGYKDNSTAVDLVAMTLTVWRIG